MQVINQHTNIADAVTAGSGTMNAWFATAILNGVGITETLAPGTALATIDGMAVGQITKVLFTPYVKPSNAKQLLKHQTIADFVTEYAGDLNNWFVVAALNGIAITEPSQPGVNYEVIVSEPTVVNYFLKYGLHVSNTYKILPIRRQGIGYMKITNPARETGNEFIVS